MNWIRVSAIFGFLSVALGAFGAHALKPFLTPDQAHIYQTAVLYQFVHTLALLGYGLLAQHKPVKAWPGYCFSGGMILFSGSLYLMILTHTPWLGAITPLGGLLFLAGWIGVVTQSTHL